jgi:uncharacterized protein
MAITIEVVYTTPHEQWIVPVSLAEPVTVSQAIITSKICDKCPEIDWQHNKVGIFGVIVNQAQLLKDHDRIEIYRPLPIDPMTRRFQRVAKERKK